MNGTVLERRNVQIRTLKGKGKNAQSFPAEVREAIIQMAGEYVKSFKLIKVTPDRKFYVSEGRDLRVIRNNEQRSIEIAGEATMHAGGNMEAIGSTFSLDVGCWFIEVGYYGKYWMDVYNIQEQRVESETK